MTGAYICLIAFWPLLLDLGWAGWVIEAVWLAVLTTAWVARRQ